jgi:hypothetical protein
VLDGRTYGQGPFVSEGNVTSIDALLGSRTTDYTVKYHHHHHQHDHHNTVTVITISLGLLIIILSPPPQIIKLLPHSST